MLTDLISKSSNRILAAGIVLICLVVIVVASKNMTIVNEKEVSSGAFNASGETGFLNRDVSSNDVSTNDVSSNDVSTNDVSSNGLLPDSTITDVNTVAEMPKGMVTAAPTAKPKSTVKPGPTAKPKATVKPGPTAKPKTTVKPGPTAKPKTTVKPGPTATPEGPVVTATANPVASAEPTNEPIYTPTNTDGAINSMRPDKDNELPIEGGLENLNPSTPRPAESTMTPTEIPPTQEPLQTEEPTTPTNEPQGTPQSGENETPILPLE